MIQCGQGKTKRSAGISAYKNSGCYRASNLTQLIRKDWLRSSDFIMHMQEMTQKEHDGGQEGAS